MHKIFSLSLSLLSHIIILFTVYMKNYKYSALSVARTDHLYKRVLITSAVENVHVDQSCSDLAYTYTYIYHGVKLGNGIQEHVLNFCYKQTRLSLEKQLVRRASIICRCNNRYFCSIIYWVFYRHLYRKRRVSWINE